MRKLSDNYSVDYVVKDKKGNIVKRQQGGACYKAIYDMDFKKIYSINLSRFLCEETEIYHKKFIKNIAKIFELNVVYKNDDEIEVIGFKKKLDIKIFLAMFRMLFEVFSSYGDQGAAYKDSTIGFLRDYCTKEGNVNYRCPLKRYIHFYIKNDVFQGGGHGIRSTSIAKIPIKSKSDLKKSKANKVLDFFQ